MSNKVDRQFVKLRKAHSDAISAREAAAKATLAVLDGKTDLHKALGSKAGAKALSAEIVALKDERRALKRLAAFVARHPAAPKERRVDTKAAASIRAKSGKAAPAKKAGKKAAADGSRSSTSAQ